MEYTKRAVHKLLYTTSLVLYAKPLCSLSNVFFSRREFSNLLRTSKVSECVRHSRGALYDLLASHGDADTLVSTGVVELVVVFSLLLLNLAKMRGVQR